MNNYIVEFIGTFMFLSVILQATAKNSGFAPMAGLTIALGLFGAIAFAASTSGAHLNPAVSALMVLNKSLPSSDLLPYVGAQLLGAYAAFAFSQMLAKNK